MKDQNIVKLFNDTFSHFEADVNPNVWINIEQGLQVPVQPISETSNVVSKKPSSINNSLLIAGITALVGIGIYFASNKPASKTDATVLTKPIIKENPVQGEQLPLATPLATSSQFSGKNTSAIASKSIVAKENNAKALQENSAIGTQNNLKVKETVSNSTSQAIIESTPSNGISTEKNHSAESKVNHPENDTPPVFNEPAETKTTATVDGKDDANDMATSSESEKESNRFFIPNTFTPNGDGFNDTFVLSGVDYKEYQLTIYDSQGSEIFKGGSSFPSWDGTLRNGQPAPPGKYTYYVNSTNLDNSISAQRGTVSLRR